MSEIEIPKKDKVKAGNKNCFRWVSREWNGDTPSALTHMSTGVVYASPGVVKIPPWVLEHEVNAVSSQGAWPIAPLNA